MEQHGVKFTTDIDRLRRSMDACRIAYLHAPLFNPALKAVAPVRKSLGVRSFFNVLGPLVNPVMPTYQLLGVYNLPMQRLYSYIYQESGAQFAVVHSLDGYDEISLTGDFKLSMAQKEKVYTPEMLGFKRVKEEELYGGETPAEAAKIFDNVLTNHASQAQTDCVIANAGFAIHVICPEKKIETCIDEARESLISGKASNTFKEFLKINS
jgi:anthranilate phosphoribosyltransferase